MNSFSDKIKNALKMFQEKGFGPTWYKIRRQLKNKTRAMLHPYQGRILRKKAFTFKGTLPTLSVVIPILGQHDLTQFCINKIIKHHKGGLEILIVDNGNDFVPEQVTDTNITLKVLHSPEGNIGVYPTFEFGIENVSGDIILWMHNDLIINEGGFDILLRYVFEKDIDLGLVGFVGSDEINAFGGRGWGTTSNFEGKTHTYKDKSWKGVPAHVYGGRFDGLTPAVFIDACSMAIRRTTWQKIGFRQDFPISSHSHDRMTCMQVLEAGQKIAVLGLACDHMDGQTRLYPDSKKYPNAYQIWCEKNNIPKAYRGDGSVDWDLTMRLEAKKRFMKEWKEDKNFIPRRV